MNRLAIMQGRIAPERIDQYQVFPSKGWLEEIELAKEFGYDGLELLVDREGVCTRLVEAGNLEECKSSYSSACLDVLAHAGNVGGVRFLESLESSLSLCEKMDIEVFIVPLVEESAPMDVSDFQRMMDVIELIVGSMRDRCVIECDLKIEDIAEILRERDIGLCFDTGNVCARGGVPENEILEHSDLIKHVHIKDRLVGGGNVPLGTGAVDFRSVGESLRKVGYTGGLACETAYGSDARQSARTNRIRIREVMGV